MKQLRKQKTTCKQENIAMKEEPNKEEQEARKLGRIQFVLVALLFVAVICAMELISIFWGKTAGTVGLVVIAIMIAAYLYKNEILSWLKKSKK